MTLSHPSWWEPSNKSQPKPFSEEPKSFLIIIWIRTTLWVCPSDWTHSSIVSSHLVCSKLGRRNLMAAVVGNVYWCWAWILLVSLPSLLRHPCPLLMLTSNLGFIDFHMNGTYCGQVHFTNTFCEIFWNFLLKDIMCITPLLNTIWPLLYVNLLFKQLPVGSSICLLHSSFQLHYLFITPKLTLYTNFGSIPKPFLSWDLLNGFLIHQVIIEFIMVKTPNILIKTMEVGSLSHAPLGLLLPVAHLPPLHFLNVCSWSFASGLPSPLTLTHIPFFQQFGFFCLLTSDTLGTLIIFDRIFGTFVEEQDDPTSDVVYGITHMPHTWNLLQVQFHHLFETYEVMNMTPDWFNRWRLQPRPFVFSALLSILQLPVEPGPSGGWTTSLFSLSSSSGVSSSRLMFSSFDPLEEKWLIEVRIRIWIDLGPAYNWFLLNWEPRFKPPRRPGPPPVTVENYVKFDEQPCNSQMKAYAVFHGILCAVAAFIYLDVRPHPPLSALHHETAHWGPSSLGRSKVEGTTLTTTSILTSLLPSFQEPILMWILVGNDWFFGLCRLSHALCLFCHHFILTR